MHRMHRIALLLSKLVRSPKSGVFILMCSSLTSKSKNYLYFYLGPPVFPSTGIYKSKRTLKCPCNNVWVHPLNVIYYVYVAVFYVLLLPRAKIMRWNWNGHTQTPRKTHYTLQRTLNTCIHPEWWFLPAQNEYTFPAPFDICISNISIYSILMVWKWYFMKKKRKKEKTKIFLHK